MRIVYATLLPDVSEEDKRFLRPPLAVGYLASFARAQRDDRDRHDLVTATELAECDSITETVQRLLRSDPELVALSVYVWNVSKVKAIIEELRLVHPSARIVVGGPEVAYTPAKAARELHPDWVCTGEGERPFLALLNALDTEPGFARSLPGMRHRCAAEMECTPRGELVDPLDDLPSPYHAGLITVAPGAWADLETMRGCPFRCRFCLYGKTFSSMRYFSLTRVRRDVAYVMETGATHIYLMDPTFNLPKDRCMALCALLKDLNASHQVKFYTEARAEVIDEPMADAFAAMGMVEVEVGLQSTAPTALRTMRRSLGEARFIQGCKLLRERGIRTDIGVILGLPGDDEGSLRRTVQFVTDRALGHLSVYRLQVLPGSEYWNLAGALGLVHDAKPPYFVHSTPVLSAYQLDRLSDELGVLAEQANANYMRILAEMAKGSKKGPFTNQAKKEERILADHSDTTRKALRTPSVLKPHTVLNAVH